MKKYFTCFLMLLFSASLQIYSQTPFCLDARPNSTAERIEEYVYKRYVTEKGREKELSIALVRPVDKLPVKKRPLVIGVHGGGFVDFCPLDPCFVKYSEKVLFPNFTPQGFVTASVQYRLTSAFDFKPPKISDEMLKEAHYKAVQDVRAAMKFIFANAEKFGVDTENVFLVGTSAGAITVLHAAFFDAEEAPKDLVEKYGSLEKREKIKGVISFSGALYDLAYLDGGDKIPVMIVHGDEDFIVPIDKGFYFGQKHLTPVYGGRAVFNEAQKKKIPAKGFFYDFGHDYPESFVNEIFRNANNFIRSNLTCSDSESVKKAK